MKTTICTFACMLMLFACKNEPKPTPPTPVVVVPPPPPPSSPTKCYVHAEGRDTSFIVLTINGASVVGLKGWEPWETDGARGSLVGTISGDTITAIFNYMIEGSIQAEEVMFRLADGKLLEGSGELKDGKILTIKNKKTLKWTDSYAMTDCGVISEQVNRAQMVADAIREEEAGKK
jgi:hypothetical protein